MKSEGNKLKAVVKLCFAAAVILALSTGFVRAVFFPKDVNEYESRMANQFPAFTAGGFADSSFQNGAEDALSDQLPLSTYLKKAYNLLSYKYQELCSIPITSRHEGKYFHIKEKEIYNGMLAVKPEALESALPRLEYVVNSFNRAIDNNPDTEFYLYYVECDTDINFETGEKVGVNEYLKGALSVPERNSACFALDGFEDFKVSFYETDHHWNLHGSYAGYMQLHALLRCGGEAMTPEEEVDTGKFWHGTRATDIGFEGWDEPFYAYRFAFPRMQVMLNGAQAADYGMQDLFLSGGGGKISYMNFYGNNFNEVVIDTGNEGAENLLIVGDSFSHAVLKLLASHFHRTVLIDGRNSPVTQDEFTEYLEKYDIDKVLFMGTLLGFGDEQFAISE